MLSAVAVLVFVGTVIVEESPESHFLLLQISSKALWNDGSLLWKYDASTLRLYTIFEEGINRSTLHLDEKPMAISTAAPCIINTEGTDTALYWFVGFRTGACFNSFLSYVDQPEKFMDSLLTA